ncbi:MAG: 1-deoxy-D-xylulose-5-phosphate reductoisomerase [Candidatus Omnitrophica bacterium]|nr:1-deoxy-D-xylulose-5-phosphate reductoisomerase [Candidatus Omnitrophota bacterium]
MKKIVILGSTGSIGQNALEVVRHFPDRFRVLALSANSNTALLLSQAKEFLPERVCVADPEAAEKLKGKLPEGIRLLFGEEGLEELAGLPQAEEVVMAISGFAALKPLIKAIENGRQVALANKEAIVSAGPLVMRKANEYKARIIPVDSEQSAIWQCLEGRDTGRIKNIYLTASGGPLRRASGRDLKKISLKRVLAHPRWKMGRKISVDSATLMNKGLELLEAMFLFGVPHEKIKVLIHPEALVHSLVEFVDGVVLAQLSATDMRIPIQYALSYPERLSNSLPGIDFYRLKKLHFEAPDFGRFPCLGLAYQAARDSGTMPAALNAANEVSVGEFLKGRLGFSAIPQVIEKVLSAHRNRFNPDLEEVFKADARAREEARRIIGELRP